uniref:Uncharacterized protein n=1 Tax=Populus trichocarpa TaxID=3694 RepID=A0A3N7FSJ3_POPTR
MHLLGRNLNIPIQRALSRRKCCLELVKMAVCLSLNVLGQVSLSRLHPYLFRICSQSWLPLPC